MDEKNLTNILETKKSNWKILWGAAVVGIFVVALGGFFLVTSGLGFSLLPESKEPQSMEAALGNASLRFIELRGRLEKEDVSENIIEELKDIRSDLAAASKNTDDETKERWRTLDTNLQEVEQVLQMTLEENKRRQEEE